MAKNSLNTPYLVSAITGKIRKGERFREHTRDQRGRWTLATVWIDHADSRILHIQTRRDTDCPKCKGSGVRKSGHEFTQRLSVDFRCIKCDGSGTLENHVEERRYILSERDLEGKGSLFSRKQEGGANPFPSVRPTPEQQKHIDLLVSEDGKARLEACRWLHRNYLQRNGSFHRFLPMLRKARWIESNGKGLTLYQFWAGKDEIPAFAYYRVLVDTKKGVVRQMGFYNGERTRKGAEGVIKDSTDRVVNWFLEGWGEEE
ncbi:MAG: hypothetical protein ACYTGH_11015 [Planctomycetota bacterium]